ncbi:hypothetical protein ACE2AJ_09395 [Aquihabitans daechungensis]|uniref:hypothetical protein n=1 Tax=Aquihabitans daechungensis TaxID=1052257 RepID=UPI003B9F8254
MTNVAMAVLATAWWFISAAVAFNWVGEDDDHESLRCQRARASLRFAGPLAVVLWIVAVVSLVT